MRKKFAQNFLFALAANALIKPAYILLIDRVVQMRAGAEAYGRYNALFNLATIFGVVLDFGLAQYATRRLTASPDAVSTEVGPLMRARLGLCAVYAVAVFAAALAMGFRGEALGLLAGILIVQTLAQTLLFLRACVASLQRFKTDALLSTLDRALLIAGMGGLLLAVRDAGGFWVSWFVAAQAVCYSIAVIVAGATLRRASSGAFRLGGSDLRAVWTAVRGAAPFALLVFFMAVYTRLDMVLLERVVSAAEAGRYAAAFRLLDVGNMVGLTVAAILLPLFGRMLAERTDTGSIVRAAVVMLVPISIAAAAVSQFYGVEIMEAFYHTSGHARTSFSFLYPEGDLLAVLMLAFPALSLTAIYSTLLTATGALRTMTVIAAVGAVVNVVLNATRMPAGGAGAAAGAAVVTQWFVAIAFILAVTRRAGLRYDFGWSLRHLLLVAVVIAAAFGCRAIALDWRVAAVCTLGVAGCGALGLRLFSVKEAARLFRR